MKIALALLPALALLSACATERAAPPPPPPVAMAPPAMSAPPPPMMGDRDGRYVGVARLSPGQRGCRVRTSNVSANVMGDRVSVMSGRHSMEGMIGPDGTVTFNDGMMMTNTRFENGMLMGESAMNNCRYTVSLRKAGMRPGQRRQAM
ncbi:hypothetical protein [Roseomonas sp. WA12]